MKADFRYGLRGVAIALLSLLLLACSEPKLAYIGSNGKLLAFGDSLTQGVGAKAGQDYPSRLAELCRCEVINAGISGEQSAAGLERLPALLDETKPDLLILLEGGNDILRGRSQVQLAQNIESMLLEAKARQIPVVLLAVPQKSLLLSPLPLYAELADKHGAILLEQTLSELLRSNELKSDTVHLNQQGYSRLAQVIFTRLQEAGAF